MTDRLSLPTLFWVGTVGLAVYICTRIETSRIEVQLVGILIVCLSLFPGYVWCHQKTSTLPVFPTIALSHVPTYGLPLINLPRHMEKYSSETAVTAGLTIAGFLLVATIVWYLSGRPKPTDRPRQVYAIDAGTGPWLLLLFLALSCSFNVVLEAGWMDLDMDTFSTVRAASLALGTFSVVGLSCQLGARALAPLARYCFYATLTFLLLAQAVSLYLSTPLMTTLVGAIAFSSTRRKLPLAWIATVFAATTFLQAGKSDMRNLQAAGYPVTPGQYPEFFGQWAQFSLRSFSDDPLVARSAGQAPQSGVERASIIHMLMLVQDKSPSQKPFLNGETYAIIPELLVPRFLHQSKPVALESQYILSVYYGRQTRAQTKKANISFGFPAEAYANFGYPGVLGLGILIGFLSGRITRYAIASSVLSYRSMLAFVFIGTLVNGERITSVLVTSFVQATVFLTLMAVVMMKPVDTDSVLVPVEPGRGAV